METMHFNREGLERLLPALSYIVDGLTEEFVVRFNELCDRGMAKESKGDLYTLLFFALCGLLEGAAITATDEFGIPITREDVLKAFDRLDVRRVKPRTRKFPTIN